jgi:hypothetical protein
MATARVTGGYGSAPSYGKVTNPTKKKTAWGGGMGSSIQSGLNAALAPPSFKPSAAPAGSTPAYKPPAAAGGLDLGNLPLDPTYDAQVGGLTRTRDTTVGGLKAQRAGTLLDYGYTESGDPANPTIAFDPSNPNSVAAQMKKRYDQAKTGNTNGMASRGLLYSSALDNAQGATDSGYSTSSDQLQKKLIAFLGQNTRNQGQAQTDYETGAGSAMGDRVSRAVAGSAGNDSAPTSAPASAAGPSPMEQLRAQVAGGTSVKTTYKNAQGHDVRVLANGTKQVSTDGGKTWKRV